MQRNGVRPNECKNASCMRRRLYSVQYECRLRIYDTPVSVRDLKLPDTNEMTFSTTRPSYSFLSDRITFYDVGLQTFYMSYSTDKLHNDYTTILHFRAVISYG